jgi:hypothetical protein
MVLNAMNVPSDLPIGLGFDAGRTTHFIVGSHPNTICVIQALMANCHIVTLAYLEAVIDAARRPNAQSGDSISPSPLEINFNAAWPNPDAFLRHPSFAQSRRHLAFWAFRGWTFVFARDQYEDFPILKNIIMRAGGSIRLLDSNERPEVDVAAFGQRWSRELNVCVYRDECWEEAFTERVSAA